MIIRSGAAAIITLLLANCATQIRIEDETVYTLFGLYISACDGLPGQVYLDVTNSRRKPIKLKLTPRDVVISENSLIRIVQTGEKMVEQCDENGVCIIIMMPVFEEQEEVEHILGEVFLSPESIELASGEIGSFTIALLNHDLADRPFTILIFARFAAEGETTRFYISMSGSRYTDSAQRTW